jgi:OOP family OmpA-OmpF porin
VEPPPQLPLLLDRSLSADTLFAFDRAELRNLTQLNALIQQIGTFQAVSRVDVLGYTDRIGTLRYNIELSQRRAAAVRNYMQRRGVAPNLINVRGMGPSKPGQGAACPKGMGRDRLITCLAPDRRVEVRVFGTVSNNAQP